MKRKYARFNDETSGIYECTNRVCKWQGTDEQKSRRKDELGYVHICPKCGNDQFYSQIKSERAECILNDAKQSNIEGCPVSLGAATKAVIVAETDAEERHKQHIEEITQAQATRLYIIACDRADELQKLEDRAVEAHRQCCKHLHTKGYKAYWNNEFHKLSEDKCGDGLGWERQLPSAKKCDSECDYIKNFLTKLNK